MFFRIKKTGDRAYLQIVESYRQDGQPRQRVIATLGRLDKLTASGQIESLLASGARFTENALVLTAFAFEINRRGVEKHQVKRRE